MIRRGDDRGQITAMVAVLAAAIILCAGLVIDGGRVFAANRHAHQIASSAARAGAQQIDLTTLRATGQHVLDGPAATAAADAYLDASGTTGSVTVAGDEITVTVSVTTSMLILGAAGVGDRTITATESARSVSGVTTEDTP